MRSLDEVRAGCSPPMRRSMRAKVRFRSRRSSSSSHEGSSRRSAVAVFDVGSEGPKRSSRRRSTKKFLSSVYPPFGRPATAEQRFSAPAGACRGSSVPSAGCDVFVRVAVAIIRENPCFKGIFKKMSISCVWTYRRLYGHDARSWRGLRAGLRRAILRA